MYNIKCKEKEKEVQTMNYDVLSVVNETKKQIEEIKKEIKEEKLELKKADEAGEWDLKGPSLEGSIEYNEKVLNDLKNRLKRFKGFKQLTINYVDDIGFHNLCLLR